MNIRDVLTYINSQTDKQATYYADIGIMEKLLKCGADPNARDEEGHNALFYVIAGMRHEDEIARFELLYRYGIDLHARDKHGNNILQFISHDGYHDGALARWLRRHGVKDVLNDYLRSVK